MDDEIWVPVRDYESKYEISNFGRVKNKNRILKGTLGNKGYIRIILTENLIQKKFLVHRLVATHFIINKDPLRKIINHKDGVKSNNHYSNLEWCNHSENLKHAYDVLKRIKANQGKKGINSTRHTKVYQYDLSLRFIKSWDCMSDAARNMGIDLRRISKACKTGGRTGNYYWSK